MFPYINLVVYSILSFAAGFFTTSINLSAWVLHGLHSYVLPESLTSQNSQGTQSGNGLRNTKGKEEHNLVDSASGNNDARHRQGESPYVILNRKDRKKKDRGNDWDERNAQIYRLNLSYSHLLGRLNFSDYDSVVVYSLVGVVNLLAYECLSHMSSSAAEVEEQVSMYDIVPLLMGLFAVCRIVWLLTKVNFQMHSKKPLEFYASIGVGSLGFIVVFYILFLTQTTLIDFGFEEVFSSFDLHDRNSTQQNGFSIISPMLAKLMIALVSGFLAGILTAPAHRSVRSFWLGTDQLKWNISMLNYAVFVQILLHLNVIVPLFASALWIKPMGELFIAHNSPSNTVGITEKEELETIFWGKFLFPAPSAYWAQDFGFTRETFTKVQLWGLLISGIVQLFLFRVNVQTYLNEVIMTWYEGLHGSKVMNIDLIRVKHLSNSYFLCRAAVQFFVPGMLVALLLGIYRVLGDIHFSRSAPEASNLLFLRTTTIFMAWWVTFSWGILTSVILALYRTGIFLVS